MQNRQRSSRRWRHLEELKHDSVTVLSRSLNELGGRADVSGLASLLREQSQLLHVCLFVGTRWCYPHETTLESAEMIGLMTAFPSESTAFFALVILHCKRLLGAAWVCSQDPFSTIVEQGPRTRHVGFLGPLRRQKRRFTSLQSLDRLSYAGGGFLWICAHTTQLCSCEALRKES